MAENDDAVKCPVCGDELEVAGIVMLHVSRRRYYGRPLEEECLLSDCCCLERQLAAAQAVNEKLPKYADTGLPFVPGRDEAWIITERGPSLACPVRIRYSDETGQWGYCWEYDKIVKVTYCPAYSAEAAAIAALALAEKEQTNG
jgi:hypothetical protein